MVEFLGEYVYGQFERRIEHLRDYHQRDGAQEQDKFHGRQAYDQTGRYDARAYDEMDPHVPLGLQRVFQSLDGVIERIGESTFFHNLFRTLSSMILIVSFFGEVVSSYPERCSMPCIIYNFNASAGVEPKPLEFLAAVSADIMISPVSKASTSVLLSLFLYLLFNLLIKASSVKSTQMLPALLPRIDNIFSAYLTAFSFENGNLTPSVKTATCASTRMPLGTVFFLAVRVLDPRVVDARKDFGESGRYHIEVL